MLFATIETEKNAKLFENSRLRWWFFSVSDYNWRPTDTFLSKYDEKLRKNESRPLLLFADSHTFPSTCKQLMTANKAVGKVFILHYLYCFCLMILRFDFFLTLLLTAVLMEIKIFSIYCIMRTMACGQTKRENAKLGYVWMNV